VAGLDFGSAGRDCGCPVGMGFAGVVVGIAGCGSCGAADECGFGLAGTEGVMLHGIILGLLGLGPTLWLSGC
jgi:hypothetical protein